MRLCLLLAPALALAGTAQAQRALPGYLEDRGVGVPVSMFGTYADDGDLLVYPFVEYYKDEDKEYSPTEFGQTEDKDYRGEIRQWEYLLFLSYGINETFAIEFETAYYTEATFKKSPDDESGVPDKIEESGLGDTQMQLDWWWWQETEDSPGLFSFLEVVFPLQKDKVLIGTKDWEFKLGVGVINGFSWGTTTARIAAEYDRGEGETTLGEYALEYLKRLSSDFRTYVGIEGSDDEVSLILELQWFVADNAFLKFNNGFGLTSKATDFAPEFGLMMVF